jgi:hypothetical protein
MVGRGLTYNSQFDHPQLNTIVALWKTSPAVYSSVALR